jgi:hypothetical protein
MAMGVATIFVSDTENASRRWAREGRDDDDDEDDDDDDDEAAASATAESSRALLIDRVDRARRRIAPPAVT